MEDNSQSSNAPHTPRMTIRLSKSSISFAMADTSRPGNILYEPYPAKSGVSPAANLREAFKTSDILQRPTHKALVFIDTPTLLIPIEEYDESQADILYNHVVTGYSSHAVMGSVLPDLNAVALFAVNKDLKLVVEDHYSDVRFAALMRPVWQYMHHRSFINARRKLYGHFHDGKMDVFSFERNRFVFSNQYKVKTWEDAVFFLLFVWKQLAMDQQHDELFLSGTLPSQDTLVDALKKYIEKVGYVNPSTDFDRTDITAIKGIPFDLLAHYLS